MRRSATKPGARKRRGRGVWPWPWPWPAARPSSPLCPVRGPHSAGPCEAGALLGGGVASTAPGPRGRCLHRCPREHRLAVRQARASAVLSVTASQKQWLMTPGNCRYSLGNGASGRDRTSEEPSPAGPRRDSPALTRSVFRAFRGQGRAGDNAGGPGFRRARHAGRARAGGSHLARTGAPCDLCDLAAWPIPTPEAAGRPAVTHAPAGVPSASGMSP